MIEAIMAPVLQRLDNIEGNDDEFVSDSEMESEQEMVPAGDTAPKVRKPKRIAVKGIGKHITKR